VDEDGELHVEHSDAHGRHVSEASAAVPAGHAATHMPSCENGVAAAQATQSVAAPPLQVLHVWSHVAHA